MGDPKMMSEAADQLLAFGSAAVPPLIAALKSENATLRFHAADVLGDFDDPVVVPALMRLLDDEEADIRRLVADLLGQRVDARAVVPLLNAAKDEDPAVREAAVRALGTMGQSLKAVGIEQTLTESMGDSDWGTRQSAAEMLIYLNAEATDAAWSLLLEDLQNDDVEVRLGTAWALAQMPTKAPQVFEVLAQLLSESNAAIRFQAITALGELGDQRAIPLLVKLLNDPDETTRQSVQAALRKLGHEGEI
jgi:HEAT repeat protein